MNRQKKKVSHSSDEDDQVSIFDSEEEEQNKNKKKENKEKNIKKSSSHRGKDKIKRSHHKTREKKLVKEEESIMKQLMGKDEKSHSSTDSEKNEFEVKVQEKVETQVKRQHKEQQEGRQLFDPYQEEWMDQYAYFNETTNLTSNVHNQLTETAYANPYNFNNSKSSHPPFTPNLLYNCTPEIDPNIQLKYEDFEEEIYQDAAESNQNTINSKDIDQIKKQIYYQQKVQAQQNLYKRDKRFKEHRKTFILQEIQRLKKEFIELEDEQDNPMAQNQDKRLANESGILLKQWKYDTSILAKKEKVIIQPVKTSNEDPPKSKTQGRIVMLNDVLAENPFLTQVQMADVLRAIDPVMNARIQRSVVLRILKMCGFKKKKVRGVSKQRNTTQSISMRYRYAMKYRDYLSAGFKCFFFDELVINEYFDKQSGWCKSQGEIQFKPEKYIDRSVVILVLLSHDGSCKWQVKVGDYSAESYCKKISSMLKKSGQGVQRKLLIANPLPYRNPKYFTEITARRGWEMLVLPSDGLGLNPLQSYFAQIRQTMKRKRFDTIETLFESVVEVLTEADKQQLGKKMNSRIDVYIDKALRKELL